MLSVRVSSLTIDRRVIEYVPESLAREHCVLPLALDGDAIRVVFGRRPSYRDSIAMLEFVLNHRLVCFVADADRIARAIDEVYLNLLSEVSNCPLDFRVECPKMWLGLAPGVDPSVRFCESCRREVQLCQDEEVAMANASLGRCVAVQRADDSPWMGLIESPCRDEDNA